MVFVRFFPLCVSSSWVTSDSRGYGLEFRPTGEEPHQPFQVLHGCRQIELLAYEAHLAQPQSAQSDVILQFCEQCLHFPPSPLRDGERRGLSEGMSTLPRWLADVDGKGPILAARAAALLGAFATALHRRIIKVSAVEGIDPDVLQEFALRAEIAVLLGQVGELVDAIEVGRRSGIFLDPDVRRDATLIEPLQQFAVAVGGRPTYLAPGGPPTITCVRSAATFCTRSRSCPSILGTRTIASRADRTNVQRRILRRIQGALPVHGKRCDDLRCCNLRFQ